MYTIVAFKSYVFSLAFLGTFTHGIYKLHSHPYKYIIDVRYVGLSITIISGKIYAINNFCGILSTFNLILDWVRNAARNE
jgi:hypothetical protein